MSFSIQKCKESSPKCLVLVADNTTPNEHPACLICDVQNANGSRIKQENEDLGKVLIEKLTKEELTDLCEAYDDGSIESIFYDCLYPEDKLNYPAKYVDPDDDGTVKV